MSAKVLLSMVGGTIRKSSGNDPASMTAPVTVDASEIMRVAYACVSNAIADERERCARICDEAAADPHGSNPACAEAEELASKIREG